MSFAVAFVLLLGAVCSEGQEQNTTDPAAWPKTVCYQLGGDSETCFSNLRPFNNANGKVPKSPSSIGTTFNLKTRSGQTIVTEQLSIGSLALEKKDTKIIVHGWLESQNGPWITNLVNAFLDMGDFNLIVVDWSQGAKTSVRTFDAYYQSAANTRLVGAQIAFLVQALEQEAQIPQSSVHIIGLSLGAQIAGYAGKRLSGLGRITGLDPAAPAFTKNNPAIRISPTDAAFVDVLHTDGGVMGLADPIGTADFYPNTGKVQPGCEAKDTHNNIIDLIRDFARKMPCSHVRAAWLFIESVKGTCQFQGYPCAPGSVCDDCGEKGCARMGYYSAVDNAAGSYYLPTTATAPFC